MKYNSRIKTICSGRRRGVGGILQGNWGMLTHNSHSFLCPQSSGMAQTFGTNVCPHFRRDSSCTSQPCCRSPRIQVRCTGNRRCETSGTWILPLTHNIVYTAGWTRSRRSRPLCTCFLKFKKKKKKKGWVTDPVNVIYKNKHRFWRKCL